MEDLFGDLQVGDEVAVIHRGTSWVYIEPILDKGKVLLYVAGQRYRRSDGVETSVGVPFRELQRVTPLLREQARQTEVREISRLREALHLATRWAERYDPSDTPISVSEICNMANTADTITARFLQRNGKRRVTEGGKS